MLLFNFWLLLLPRLMRNDGWPAMCIDKQQKERVWILGEFKAGSISILVATDVAPLGLDADYVKKHWSLEPSTPSSHPTTPLRLQTWCPCWLRPSRLWTLSCWWGEQTWKKFLTFLEPSLELKYFPGKCGILDLLNIATKSVKSSQNWQHIPYIPELSFLGTLDAAEKQCLEKKVCVNNGKFGTR